MEKKILNIPPHHVPHHRCSMMCYYMRVKASYGSEFFFFFPFIAYMRTMRALLLLYYTRTITAAVVCFTINRPLLCCRCSSRTRVIYCFDGDHNIMCARERIPVLYILFYLFLRVRKKKKGAGGWWQWRGRGGGAEKKTMKKNK